MMFAQDASTVVSKSNTVKDTTGKTDLVDIAKRLFHIKPNKKRKLEEKRIYFSVLPVSSSVPGGSGHVLVTSTTAGIYLGSRRTTNISSATFAPYFNLKGRFGLPLRTSIWLPNNSWTIQGDLRLLVYPQYTWGLGNDKDHDHRTLVDYRYIRFYEQALKRIRPYFFAGAGYNLDYYMNIKSDSANIDLKTFTGYPYGLDDRSVSSGVSFSLLYDSRNNSINPLPGAYANVVFRINPSFLGNDLRWQSLYADVRKYISVNPANPDQQNTFAFWSYFWTVLHSNAPYLNLPSIGWDPGNRSGRGVDQNRYRGKSLFYLESEYRRDITENGLFGFVVFANVNTVSGSESMFRSWHPAVGTGLRIKFNKGSNTNMAIDFGVSKGYKAIKLNLGEAF
ncbi:hypothetical protein [Chitinophaga sp. CF118]|uniref:hypothetical protein n=1 Tax=Chitinophaga sp. CF118 TaxID=1884367 RepID=UPI002100DD10|nr:hypothetical protein [Chitinophaga sp. CF118]